MTPNWIIRRTPILWAAAWCVSLQAQPVDLEALSELARTYETHIGQVEQADLLVDRHIAQLHPLLPESVKRRIIRIGSHSPGDVLLAWWRRQDPLPASPANERMLEHLRRVAHAEKEFACLECPAGFDARGEIYVRYGNPERITEITFDDPQLIDAIFQPGISISPGDFPDNEFWRYLNVDRDAYFLFVEDQNQYRLAQTSDLVPSTLRSGFQPGGRGLVKSQMALAVMRSVYRQLAMEHPHFGARFNDVDLWLSARESTGRLQSRDLTDNVRILTGADLVRGAERSEGAEAGIMDNRPAHEFVQTVLSNARTEDLQVAYQQETLVPRVASDITRVLPEFYMAIRHARFLNENGKTRTEVYWSPELGALHTPGGSLESEYLLKMHAQYLRADYTQRSDSSKLIRIVGIEHGADSIIPPQSFAMEGEFGMYNLTIQWDQYRVTKDSAPERIRVATAWIDSLEVLDAAGTALEMSDLRPVYQVDEQTVLPYPFTEVTGALALGLQFEVYHLVFDRDGESRYTVTYEIIPARGRRSSSVTSSSRGTSRTALENIELDLSDWTDTVQIVVTVVDDVSGMRVSRSIDFTLIR